jgi:hypothetical protein
VLTGESGTDSRTATEEELRGLRYQENILVDKIVHHEGSMKSMIIELADSMARRFELLDPLFPADFSLNQISTEIGRILRSQPEPCPIGSWVRDYLPTKYKNTNMQREVGLISQLNNIIEHCAVSSRNSIEQSTTTELESQLEYITKAEHLKDDIGTQLTTKKWAIRAEGMRRGVSLCEEKYRDQISSKDYRFEIPDDLTLQQANEQVMIQGARYEKEIHTFYQVNYPEYPATVIEDALKYANSTRVMANIWAIINEKKWSGDVVHWLDRNYWKKAQSSHKSGNSTYFPTTLCARCSSNIENDPKDYHVTRYDKSSPTGYRCDNCGCIEILVRENTREQIGDKSAEMDRFAEDIIKHIPDYTETPMDWRERYLNPAIYARKKAISNKFRIAAFGKEEMVIPRKENKT